MKLIYPEVDIVPGRAGQRPQVTPVREEQLLPGSSVIRLSNTTSQENAYTIRLRCEERFWQDSWYTVIALPPGQGAENAPPPGKPDQRGPQDRWVKIYVPRGGTRDVLLRFNVPSRPESRAGKYGYFVEVETQVIGPTEAGRRKDRVSQVPGVAIVRPFYKWSVDLSPEERRVGRRHRSADFDIVVTNEGNDWLYCDMQLPRPKDLTLDSPTLRLAVPPPEPGETLPAAPGDGEARPGTQRTLPLATATKLKVFRGDITRQPILLSAQRVDAPSIPPSASDGYAGLGAVVAAATTEKQQVAGDRALVYHPPVPAKFTDFFNRSAGSLRSLAFGVMGIAAAGMMILVLWQNAFYEGVRVEPNALSAQPGGTLLVSGQFLQGCKMYMGTKDNYVEVSYHPTIFNMNRMIITNIPKELNHKIVKVRAQRFVGILPFLTPLLPSNESKSLVQIGNLSQAPAVAAVEPVEPGPYKPGAQFSVMGRNLGSSGAVLVNNLKAKAFWSPEKVTVTLSPAAAPRSVLPVVVQPEDGVPLSAGSIQVAAPTVVVAAGGTSAVVNPPVGGGAGGGGGAAAGGAGGGAGAAGGAAAGGRAAAGGGTSPPIVKPHLQAHSGVTVVKRPMGETGGIVNRPASLLSAPPYDLVLTGNYPGAIGAAEDRLRLNGRDTESLALQAYAMIKIGQAARAQPLVARALALTPPTGRARSLALVAKGALDAAQGQTGAATADFQQAGNAAENLGLPYLALADFLPKVHQEAEIKPLLQEALTKQLQPNEASAIQAKIAGG